MKVFICANLNPLLPNPLLIVLTCLSLFSGVSYAQDDTEPSTPATPPPRVEVAAPIPSQLWQQQDLQRFIQADKRKTLLAGEDEFEILINEQKLPVAKGVAILIADVYPTHSARIVNLSSQLTAYGFTTLTLLPPDRWQPQQPELFAAEQTPASDGQVTDDQAESANEAAQTDPALQAYQNALMQRIVATREEAANYQGLILMVAEGVNAAQTVALFNEEQLQSPDAFVSLSIYMPDADSNQQLAQALASTVMPTLDIFHHQDNRWTLATASQRRKQAGLQLKAHYRQTELIGPLYSATQQQKLSRAIYGWTRSLGW